MGKSSRQKRKASDYNAAGDNASESSDLSYNKQLSGEQPASKVKTSDKRILAGAVSIITFLVYLPCIRNSFIIWDDEVYVTDNPIIRSIDFNLIRSAFFEFHAANWHPVTWMSHALDYAIWGLNPVGHHLTNVILHALNSALVVFVIIRLLELYRERIATEGAHPWLKERGILITAGAAGLLFGLHPVSVETVAWVAERKNLLCALFFLMSILTYIKYVSGTLQNSARSVFSNKLYLSCLGFFLFALMSKPMAVSLPFVLLIIDWYPSNRIHSIRSFRNALIEKIPFLLLCLGSTVLTVLAQKAGGAMELMEIVPLQARLLVAADSLIAYFGKMILPLNLLPFYPYPDYISLLSVRILTAIFLVLGITTVCLFIAKKKSKILLAVWCYYVITLVPVLGIVQVGGQQIADRYAYFPSLGLFLMAGLVIALGIERIDNLKSHRFLAKLSVATAFMMVLITLGHITVRQIHIWKNDFTLWTYAIEKKPGSAAKAHINRGVAFSDQGDFDKALEDYNTAIRLNPLFFEAYLNRAFAFSETGKFDKAIADFDKAIALRPDYYDAHNNKGMVYERAGLFEKAIEEFSRSLEINTNQPVVYYKRGLALLGIGYNERELRDINQTMALARQNPQPSGSRENRYQRENKLELAVSDFKKACDLGDMEGCRALQTSVKQQSPFLLPTGQKPYN